MRVLLALALTSSLAIAQADLSIELASLQVQLPIQDQDSKCNCNGDSLRRTDGDQYICGDKRLGPVELPAVLPALSFISDYHRFGKLTPDQFLKAWWVSEKNDWKWPEYDGFVTVKGKNESVKGVMTLARGTRVDRFGSTKGKFVSVADAPFNQRSIPPVNLNTVDGKYPFNYHVYEVVKNLTVLGGPVTPTFEQPGLGAQFYVGQSLNRNEQKDTTIADLLSEMGGGPYLSEVPTKEIDIGPGPDSECGR